jgi:uncharacterized membrane protein
MRPIRALIAAAAAAVLVFAAALPAYADHNAGAGLTDALGGPTACYAGASTPGTPPVDISTRTWTTARNGGRLHLVCYFTVPLSMPAPDGGLGEDKGPWLAPRRITTTVSAFPNCLPPGADAASETWANGDPSPVPKSATRVVAYRTSLVMYCSWPLASLR